MVDTFLSGGVAEAGTAQVEGAAASTAGTRDTVVVKEGAAAEGAVALTPEQIATADKEAATAAVTAAVAKMTPEQKATYEALPADKKAEADTKVATDAKAASEKAAATAKFHGAPETYADFKVPEGMELDKERVGAFTPLAQKLNLSQEGSQELVDFYAGIIKEQETASMKRWETTNEDWRTATKADKEIGGTNIEATKTAAKSAMKLFGTPELAQTAEAFGWANHPEFLRFAARVGKAAAEDKLHLGGAGGGEEKSIAERLYPSASKP